MEKLFCPYCNSKENKALKSWLYGPEKGIKVTHLKCSCGKTYRLYESKKSSWTIPNRFNLTTEKNFFRY